MTFSNDLRPLSDCTCGGKAEIKSWMDGFEPIVRIKCPKCRKVVYGGVDDGADYINIAIDAWNAYTNAFDLARVQSVIRNKENISFFTFSRGESGLTTTIESDTIREIVNYGNDWYLRTSRGIMLKLDSCGETWFYDSDSARRAFETLQ